MRLRVGGVLNRHGLTLIDILNATLRGYDVSGSRVQITLDFPETWLFVADHCKSKPAQLAWHQQMHRSCNSHRDGHSSAFIDRLIPTHIRRQSPKMFCLLSNIDVIERDRRPSFD